MGTSTGFSFDWQVAFDCLPYLAEGLPYTLGISTAGVALGFATGVVAGLARLARGRGLRWPAIAYIEVFRGTPVLVQVLFLYYGLPDLLGRPIGAVSAAVAAIALNSGAYISEIVRGAVQSIDLGQHEASRAIGLTHGQAFRHVIWPQALRRMAPPLGNQAIVSLKDTSLFSVIGVGELVRQGQLYIATTFSAFEVYFMVALLYLAITLSLSLAVRRYERWAARAAR